MFEIKRVQFLPINTSIFFVFSFSSFIINFCLCVKIRTKQTNEISQVIEITKISQNSRLLWYISDNSKEIFIDVGGGNYAFFFATMQLLLRENQLKSKTQNTFFYLFFSEHQGYSLKVPPPPFSDFCQNRRGYPQQNFLLRISLIKEFSGASRRIGRRGYP